MGGLLGGLLRLFEPLGGYVLAFLIGPKAWNDRGKTARLISGGISAGALIGGMVGLFLPLGRPELGVIGSVMGGALVVGCFLPFAVLFLEWLRKMLDGR